MTACARRRIPQRPNGACHEQQRRSQPARIRATVGGAAVGAAIAGRRVRSTPRPSGATPSSAPAIAAAACGGATSSSATPTSLEFVGLCDINPKRAAVASEHIGVSCPTFTNFDEMIDKTKPDLLMVTTVDGFPHEYIIKGLDRGIDVMTEKPMTTDETKCQAILDAEKRNNGRRSSSPSTTATRRRTSR